MEDNLYKIATPYAKVRRFLMGKGWAFQGKSEEMDAFRNNASGKEIYAEDISEDFPVTFLMGDLSLAEFGEMARHLTPQRGLLEVESSWEGEPTTIVVVMTREEVEGMFGEGTKMRELGIHSALTSP